MTCFEDVLAEAMREQEKAEYATAIRFYLGF